MTKNSTQGASRLFSSTKFRRRALATTFLVGGLGLAGALNAQEIQSFDRAEKLVIRDFTGTVEIATDGDRIAALTTDGAKAYAFDITEKDGVLTIAGEPRPRNFKLYRELKKFGYGNEALQKYLADYPSLQIVVPSDVDVTFDEAIVIARGGDIDGHLSIMKGTINGEFGDVGSADVNIAGMGSVSVGRIANALDLAIGGSGDFQAVSAGASEISIGGSGDVTLGSLSGSVGIRINGSGDVNLSDVAGSFDASINGSGDIEAGRIDGGASVSISGSGDVELGAVNGPTSVGINGGGDISIDEGRAENLRVRISGSGDFTFGGTSTNLDASIAGSGDVTVRKNEGTIKTSGDGTVRVGDTVYRRKK